MTRAGVRLAKNQRAVMAAIRVLPVSLAAGTRFRYQPVTFSVVEATGIYASDVRVVEEGLLGHAAGLFLLPFDDDPNTTLQDNILTAWEAGQIVGADVVGVISGNYVVPEPSTISLAALGLFGGACVLLRKKVMP